MIAPRVIADSPMIDADEIERRLRASDLWLTPRAVEGFREHDFEFLDEGERTHLAELVEAFRNVAEQVPQDGPADEEQVREALRAFQGVLEILEPHRYADEESLVIGKKLQRELAGRLPEWVREFRMESGPDSTGDPGVWIWVVLDDEATDRSRFAENNRTVRKLIFDAAEEASIDRWPYIRFRSVSEQQTFDPVVA